jgi:hypothetical protein
MDFFFSRLEGVASCWFIFSRIKKDESQGENCHATTMLSQEKPIAIIFFLFIFFFSKAVRRSNRKSGAAFGRGLVCE